MTKAVLVLEGTVVAQGYGRAMGVAVAATAWAVPGSPKQAYCLLAAISNSVLAVTPDLTAERDIK
jgi:hypothetical protein